MKLNTVIYHRSMNLLFFVILTFISLQASASGFTPLLQDSNMVAFSGRLVGENSHPLPYALISVEKTSISVVTNSEGDFTLKIPSDFRNNNLIITFLGYQNKRIPLSELKFSGNVIKLIPFSYKLPELEVLSKDAHYIIEQMLYNIDYNYSRNSLLMTAFYRETIRKKNRNISLAEAIVDVYKSGYNSLYGDMASLYKSRKKTDYQRLDTVIFKLMGGPFNNIYLDMMRYPTYIFTEDVFEYYQFAYLRTDVLNDRTVYVVDFRQKDPTGIPLYYGLLYVDAENFALARAEFDLNLSKNKEATQMFVKKKPFNAKVSITKAHYIMEYRLADNLWHYSYSRVDLGLRINWKRRLFHTYYNSSLEMAATNWTENALRADFRLKKRIKPTVVMQDETSGFEDPDFWGMYNIIEPDKSIENAIQKIQKQLENKKQ